MLTSNVQWGNVLTRGEGQIVHGSLYWPPPKSSERMDNPHNLLHHLLQEYLVERDVNFISVNLRCLLQTFNWVTFWQVCGGEQAVQGGLSCPPPSPPLPRLEFQREWIICKLYYTLFQSILRCSHQMFSWVTYWQGVAGGGSCLGRFILPPSRISERIGNPKILLHRLLQEHLVERDVNFISVNLRCLLQTFNWVTFWQVCGGEQAVQGGLSCPPPSPPSPA